MATLDSARVKDYMSTKLITFTPDMEVMRAVNTLVQHGIAGAPVVDKDGKVVGMFSERDCLSVALVASQDTCIAGPVSQFMSTKVVTVDPEMTLMQLATMFVAQSYRRYPVLENGKLVGQISRSDVMRAINSLC
ncbi:MAG TPA: CBS domain-containing protein [Nevskia sp.]|nr:CBS domain-containing protein [Nevskia sp.]